jgi:hypothetical protein
MRKAIIPLLLFIALACRAQDEPIDENQIHHHISGTRDTIPDIEMVYYVNDWGIRKVTTHCHLLFVKEVKGKRIFYWPDGESARVIAFKIKDFDGFVFNPDYAQPNN